MLMCEAVCDELPERHANRVPLTPVVGAVTEDEGELVQRELRGVFVYENRERRRREHVGIVRRRGES